MNLDAGYQTYVDYICSKIHFNEVKFVWNPEYNYRKISFNSFLKRRDRTLFYYMSVKYPYKNTRAEFLISAFLYNKNIHISEILYNDEVKRYHLNRLSRVHALSYTFEQECEHLLDYLSNTKQSFKSVFKTMGEQPIILRDRNKIFQGFSYESFALIDKAIGFTNQPKIDPLWEEESLRILKYSKLLPIQNENFKTTLNKIIYYV